MKDIIKVLRNLRGYKTEVILVIIFNILLSIFTVVSIPILIPFFQLLFNRETQVEKSSNEYINQLNEFFVQIIDTQGRDQALITVCGIILVIFFLKNLSRYMAIYFLAPIRTGVVHDLREQLYQKYLSLPYGEYVNLKAGDLISRITADIQEVEISIIKMIEIIFKSPLIIIGSIAFMIFVSPQLSLFVLVLLVFTVFIIGGISKSLKRKSTVVQERLGNITSQVEESVYSMKVIKAYNGQEEQYEKFEKENEGYRSMLTQLIRRQDLSSPLSEFLGITIVLALMWFGARLVFAGSLLPETFFAFIVAFYQVIDPAKSLSNAYFNIQKGLAAYERVEGFLLKPEEESSSRERDLVMENALEIKNLSFGYEEGAKVLDDINTTIRKGETVALVGTSGGGKTTLIDVISGIYPVQDGEITLDGKDIRSFSLKEWRGLFGIVSQVPILFHDTVARNIGFAQDVSREDIIRAAKVANAHEFISDLPQGYDTVIGDKGMKLSGGQRQRITIARAVLYNPEILILDEATSSLDSESEKLVQEALEHITRDRTSIVIAHRLSTVTNADRILVMDGGRILDYGRHDELLDRSKVYQKLVSMQSFSA